MLEEIYHKGLGVPYERRGPEPSTCSFSEFWHAWLDGNLGALMDKHDMTVDEGDPFTTDSRSTPLSASLRYRKGDGPRPSIWRLNHYLRLTSEAGTSTLDVDQYHGMKEALIEYGFDARMNAKTKILWTEFYQRLVRRCGLLRVQEARDKGELLELAENLGSRDWIDDEVRSVLWRLGRR